MCVLGLSPPTRGSHGVAACAAVGLRSIPAHTGKPSIGLLRLRAIGVYPRPHGEATCDVRYIPAPRGLSPPTRGSLRHHQRAERHRGSIPAHTGKPLAISRRRRVTRVYPRPHGEAGRGTLAKWRKKGLSPPTRGSPSARTPVTGPAGSIPAHTGKPKGAARPLGLSTVYPRPHGEAKASVGASTTAQGLSPPTRGSLPSGWTGVERIGSIPAHTGKPAMS